MPTVCYFQSLFCRFLYFCFIPFFCFAFVLRLKKDFDFGFLYNIGVLILWKEFIGYDNFLAMDYAPIPFSYDSRLLFIFILLFLVDEIKEERN